MYFSLLMVYKMNIYLEFQKKFLFILLPFQTLSSGSFRAFIYSHTLLKILIWLQLIWPTDYPTLPSDLRLS